MTVADPDPPEGDRTVMAAVPHAGEEPGRSRRATALALGDLLNGIYRIDRFIARGGMGEVFEGTNVASHEKVAIKAMRGHLVDDPKVLAMFRKEAQVLTRISHAALVHYRVFARDPDLDLYYIVTDFIEGEPLSDVLDGKAATLAEFVELGRRLASGLQAAHDFGAVHRDMSPDNVLLPGGRVGGAKIIDFGIAKSLDASSETVVGEGFAGKLGFVSPEQFGEYGRQIGPWTDVYGTALVLLAFLRGKAPDMGRNVVEAIERRRMVPDLHDLPPPVEQLLRRMLAPDPEERIRSMADVLAGIDGIEAADPAPDDARGTDRTSHGTPEEVRAEIRRPRPPEPAGAEASGRSGGARRRRLLWPSIVMAVLFALIVGGYLLRSSSDGGPRRSVAAAVANPRPQVTPVVSAPVAEPIMPGNAGSLKELLAAMPCAWLQAGQGGPSDTMELTGEAPDPETIVGRMRAIGASSGDAPSKIDATGVRQMPQVRCQMIAALRDLETGSARAALELRSLDANPRQAEHVPGCRVGSGTALNIELTERDPSRHFLLFGISPSGIVHRIVTGPIGFARLSRRHPEKFEIGKGGVYRVKACYRKTGTLGLVLIDSVGRIDLQALASLTGDAPQPATQAFKAAAAAGFWRARSIWLTVAPPEAASRPTAAALLAKERPAIARVARAEPRSGAPSGLAACQRYVRSRWESIGTTSRAGCIANAFTSDCKITFASFGSIILRRSKQVVEAQVGSRWTEVGRASACAKRKNWPF